MKHYCSYCDNEAEWETMVEGIYLCDRPDCAYQFVIENCEPIRNDGEE